MSVTVSIDITATEWETMVDTEPAEGVEHPIDRLVRLAYRRATGFNRTVRAYGHTGTILGEGSGVVVRELTLVGPARQTGQRRRDTTYPVRGRAIIRILNDSETA